ncbi:MAG: Pullulanase [Candidatus Marinimicrobia bacterium]|nr:Pullulanase [Candidatus Neomarinimicrobiota bacterium]
MYAHTGLITENSSGPTDWQYVVGDWGTTNAPVLTHVEDDIWKLPIGDVYEFYGAPESEVVLQLALVFRNADGSQSGRAEGGGDIFMDLYESGMSAVLIEPALDLSYGDPLRSPSFLDQQSVLPIRGTAAAIGTQLDSLYLITDSAVLEATVEDTLNYSLSGGNMDMGAHTLYLVAVDTAGVRDSTSFIAMVNPPVNDAPRPQGIEDGITYNDDNSVTLSLFAPYKDFIYVIGDFNDWKVDTTYYMNRQVVNSDSVLWWITIDDLNPGDEYAFQYLIDGDIRVADPYTQKVLDPWNDQYISGSTYPDLKPYPYNKTSEMVGIINPTQTDYTWTTDNYTRPANEDLVIYELLIRDFLDAHDYATLIDTLDYLDRLGVTAIELMPVNEFEGNISWGYNPAFYFAPDKYYGPAAELKAFIDDCHSRGMAVILDIVLNHSFGQSPLVRLYNEGNYGAPTSENPWYNTTARHPYNVGYDFNHESQATQYFVDRVNEYWLTEYHADGFRFDLSKGFTQQFTSDVGAWGEYDASRIAILERMADQLWAVDSGAYVILEHFAENSEEQQLTNYGMMAWGNMNGPYSQSAMGYLNDGSRSSDLSWGYYGNRSWSEPHLVTYMESHDKPWLMYKNLQYGNSSGNYDITELETALQRIQLVATFFLTYPGPKMMWQFGELGYDEYLPESGPGRTSPKPIHWEYLDHPARYNLYKFFQALLDLRNSYDVFTDPETAVSMRVGRGETGRRIQLTHSSMDVNIIGNFGVTPVEMNPNFQYTGTWYEYFTGDTLEVTNTDSMFTLGPGQFQLYSTQYIEPPDVQVPTAIESGNNSLPTEFTVAQNYPNPFNAETAVRYALPRAGKVRFRVFNLRGQLVEEIVMGRQTAGYHTIRWDADNLTSGMYFYTLDAQAADRKFSQTRKLILIK